MTCSWLMGIAASALLTSLPVPKESLRFAYVCEQNSDTSCGLAAVSSLLTLYWGTPVSEAELMLEYRSQLQEDGAVSMLDVSDMLESRGLITRCFRMSLDQLQASVRNYAPVVVHLERGSGHFALVLAVTQNRVLVADPARGVFYMYAEAFAGEWTGVTLLCVSKDGSRRPEALDHAVEVSTTRIESLEKWSW